jgi:hypothetical protein
MENIQALANIVIIDLMWTYFVWWAVLSHEVATTIATQFEDNFYHDSCVAN